MPQLDAAALARACEQVLVVRSIERDALRLGKARQKQKRARAAPAPAWGVCGGGAGARARAARVQR